MNPFTTLINVDELKALQAAGAPLCLLDASFDLANPAAGRALHAASHVPGARHIDLEGDLSAPKQPGGAGGRHPLPRREAFAATAGRLGVAPGVQVVVYDRSGGIYASRAWWMLRWLGHGAVAVLDGGWAAWATQGAPDTGAVADAALPPLPLAAPLVSTVDAGELMRRLGRWPLIDARAGERFRGEVEPLDAQAGHIPGALNRPFTQNLGADGRFKPAAELHADFVALLGAQRPGEVVHQCGSGVTACHNLLAMETAGLAGSRLYPGSWSEWSADPTRPVARG